MSKPEEKQHQTTASARAVSAQSYIPTITADVRHEIDETLKNSTPTGAYAIGMAVMVCNQEHIAAPSKDLLDSLRRQTSTSVAESFLNRWINEQVDARNTQTAS